MLGSSSRRRLTICWGILLLFMSALAAPAKDKEKEKDNLAFTVPDGWKVGRSKEDQKKRFLILEFVREGETPENWKEVLVISSFAKPKSLTPEKMYDEDKARREKQCPGSTTWSVIASDTNSITFEMQDQPCLGEVEQSELERILFGPHTVYMLQYTQRVKEFTPENRDIWTKFLAAQSLH